MYETSVINTAPFNLFLTRKKTIWYSFCDGEWSNPNTWISNSVDRKGLIGCPQIGDDVYINHNIDYSNSNTGVYLFNNTVKNLYIGTNGTLTALNNTTQNYLRITGDLQCSGTIDFSSAISPITIELQGYNNFIVNFLGGTQSTVYYSGTLSQNIVNVTYYNLSTANSLKSTIANLVVNNILSINSGTLELSTYNAAVYNISLSAILSKSAGGTFTVINSSGTNFGVGGSVTFTGNPTVNWSGNMTGDLRYGVNFGAGTFNFLTNGNLNFSNSGNVPGSIGSNYFLIASGVTISVTGTAWLNNGSVTGVDGTSILNISTQYGYGSNNVAMPVGVFNYNYSGTSTIWMYVTMTLPSLSYYNLQIANSATVTLGSNISVSNNLSVNSGTLQLSSYNFTVSGATTYGGTILASGAGTANFASLTAENSTGKIDFSAGNPTVNLSGNISSDVRSGFNFGSGTIKITASLTLGVYTSGTGPPTISWNILIASGVTLTNSGYASNYGGLATTGTINGVDSTSIFVNKSVLNYSNATAPMVTGKLYCNQATNGFTYGLPGNQDITVPSDPTSPGYQNLTLNGSGAKRLLGNISVKGTYTLTSPATLNMNGYTLTNP
jgi:hypothetical protein